MERWTSFHQHHTLETLKIIKVNRSSLQEEKLVSLIFWQPLRVSNVFLLNLWVLVAWSIFWHTNLAKITLSCFFGVVRSAGGFNNNPTCGQFVAAYKRLLMRSHIKGGNGNCKYDSTVMLYHFDKTYAENKEDITTTALKRKYDLDDRAPLKCDHDFCDTPQMSAHYRSLRTQLYLI